MSTEAKACRARPRAAARGFAGSGLGLALAVGAALLPKCPLCLAGYLAVFGLASAAGVLAPILAPLAAVTALGSVATLVILVQRARAPDRRPGLATTQESSALLQQVHGRSFARCAVRVRERSHSWTTVRSSAVSTEDGGL